ncbi:MAG: hypothetical protein AABX39_05870 [Nanoarchaeota archaeon]
MVESKFLNMLEIKVIDCEVIDVGFTGCYRGLFGKWMLMPNSDVKKYSKPVFVVTTKDKSGKVRVEYSAEKPPKVGEKVRYFV